MKRLHVNVAVADLKSAISYYNALFDSPPTVLKPDYAKWRLDDPRMNFSIAQRGGRNGVDHLGIEVDSEAELDRVAERLVQAEAEVAPQKNAHCCYARSEKAWSRDPDGVVWETFFTHGEITVYGDDRDVAESLPKAGTKACCDRSGRPEQRGG